MTTRVLTPDICVIGAGSGGLSVAAAAAAFGVDVVLIEKGRMGGDCLNFGCVPSKSLIAAAHHAHIVRQGARMGVDAGEPTIDFSRVHDHIHGVIAAIAPHDSQERFEALGVTVLRANACFLDADTVEAGNTRIRARRFVVAAGSSPAVPPIPGLDSQPYFTNETIFDLSRCPGKLVIIGGGPIGIELAQAYRRLGAAVTVIEAQTALGREDPVLSKPVLDALRQEGVEILEQAKVVRVAARAGAGQDGDDADGIAVTVEADHGAATVAGSHLLVAVGRAPNLDGLGLEAAGIDHDKRGIRVDTALRTSNRRVYAIGDIAGGLQFTHAASYHAGLVVRAILFRLPVRNLASNVPRVTYTDPELAHVGLSEAEARARYGDRIKVLTASFAENDRARAEGRTEGLVKLVTQANGRILGAGVIGTGAGDQIDMWSLAVSRKLKASHMAGVVLPYPTRAEAGKRAAIAFFADSVKNPWVGRLLRFLRFFG